MKKRALALLLAGLLALCAAGCGSGEKAETPEEPVAPAAEPQPLPEEEAQPEIPAGTNPLTGLPMDPAEENNRPVAVMFNNLKAAQPQLGISQADVIYEVPAEGGITRMLGLFQSLDGVGTLGSIRSTREYYLELALGHDALLVHAGGSPAAYQKIPAWGVDNMDGVNGGSDAKIFWRDPERRKTMRYEHTLVTSGEAIQGYLDQGHFRREHPAGYIWNQVYGENAAPSGGTEATQITVKFSNYKTGTFAYDPERREYLAGQYGGAYLDGATGEQVHAANVLVLETSISNVSGDTAGRINVKLTGSGRGTFFCGGRSVPIQWSKADRNSPFVYTREDGTPLVLRQGKSYICILSPKRSTVTVE